MLKSSVEDEEECGKNRQKLSASMSIGYLDIQSTDHLSRRFHKFLSNVQVPVPIRTYGRSSPIIENRVTLIQHVFVILLHSELTLSIFSLVLFTISPLFQREETIKQILFRRAGAE